MFVVTEKPIDPNAVAARVSSPEAGAISIFVGVTRNFTGSEKVEYLIYEAYRSMAVRMMEKLARLTKERYPVEKIAIVHRIGKVAVGEASVAIAVSAAHREGAIRGCHFAIDKLKEIVPIWKKEFFQNGRQKWIANRQRFD